jgi:hypothetical protein
MSETSTRILIGLLRMYFARTWEFGSDLSKLRNWRATPLTLRKSGHNQATNEQNCRIHVTKNHVVKRSRVLERTSLNTEVLLSCKKRGTELTQP